MCPRVGLLDHIKLYFLLASFFHENPTSQVMMPVVRTEAHKAY